MDSLETVRCCCGGGTIRPDTPGPLPLPLPLPSSDGTTSRGVAGFEDGLNMPAEDRGPRPAEGATAPPLTPPVEFRRKAPEPRDFPPPPMGEPPLGAVVHREPPGPSSSSSSMRRRFVALR